MGKSDHMQTFNSCTVSFPKRDFFDVLTPDQKKLMDDNTVNITYKKGEIICKHGTFAPHIIFLKKGLVKVYLEGARDNLILKLAVPGSLIGLSSLSNDDTTFHYTASTYLDSEASLIVVLLESLPLVLAEILKMLAYQNKKRLIFCFKI